eukprot:8374021-Alexandrium_andersonii.AAC.1
MSTMAGRVVGVETTQRALSEGAASAVQELITQARAEFGAQAQSLVTLREQAQAEILAIQEFANVTRKAVEDP